MSLTAGVQKVKVSIRTFLYAVTDLLISKIKKEGLVSNNQKEKLGHTLFSDLGLPLGDS